MQIPILNGWAVGCVEAFLALSGAAGLDSNKKDCGRNATDRSYWSGLGRKELADISGARTAILPTLYVAWSCCSRSPARAASTRGVLVPGQGFGPGFERLGGRVFDGVHML